MVLNTMLLGFRSRIRHPFYPDLKTTPAAEARKSSYVLSGTYPELIDASDAGAQALRAVFVLNYLGGPFLNDGERDELWERFHVPVYGLLLNQEGNVLGYECEAQDGLHVPEEASLRFAQASVVEAGQCSCGRPGRRLMLHAPKVFGAAQAAD